MDFAEIVRRDKKANGGPMVLQLPGPAEAQATKTFIEMPDAEVGAFNEARADSIVAGNARLDF